MLTDPVHKAISPMSEKTTQLSPAAASLVRRLLAGKCPGHGPGHGRCPSEEVAFECTQAGLAVQVEHPLHEPRFMYILDNKAIRRRAEELGFAVSDGRAPI
jgi:hypothetical protein